MILGGLLFVLAGVSKPAAKKAKKARADSSPDHSSARTNAKTNISRGFAKSFSPENSFGKTESAFRPAALPRNFLGRTPKEKHPFLFQKKFHPRQIRNARSVFSFGVAGVLASAWGFGSFVQFPLEKSSRKVYNYSTHIKTRLHRRVFICVCRGWDLNPHELSHQLLRLARLPISPPRLILIKQYEKMI